MRIAIQGHSTRGADVKKILEILTDNSVEYNCDNICVWYEIHGRHIIPMVLQSFNYKYYTLEKFEDEFPFKIGDEVTITTNFTSYKVVALEYYNNRLCYKLDNGLHYRSEMLTFYNTMKKEEKNITLTLDKAKEWYNKGGELKEIALQAFTKEELNPLPKSWEEYCKGYKVPAIIFGPCVPLKYIALWKLEQLRDCYRQGWKPDWNGKDVVSSINYIYGNLSIYTLYTRKFLSFQSKKVAEEFLKNFEPLIKEAGDLI